MSALWVPCNQGCLTCTRSAPLPPIYAITRATNDTAPKPRWQSAGALIRCSPDEDHLANAGVARLYPPRPPASGSLGSQQAQK